MEPEVCRNLLGGEGKGRKAVRHALGVVVGWRWDIRLGWHLRIEVSRSPQPEGGRLGTKIWWEKLEQTGEEKSDW